MKRTWILFAIAALILASCGPEPEPTMSPADIQGTAMAAALTMVAETQAAIPTATPLPPTEAPTATPLPTNTVPPLILASPTQSIGELPTTLPTNTPVSVSGSNDPCNQTLTSWEGESAKMTVVNATKPQGTIVLSIWVNTNMGQCGYIPANPNSFNIPLGSFSAGAFVNGKKDFKVFGGGVINQPGNYSLWVTNDTITLKAGCAPNC